MGSGLAVRAAQVPYLRLRGLGARGTVSPSGSAAGSPRDLHCYATRGQVRMTRGRGRGL